MGPLLLIALDLVAPAGQGGCVVRAPSTDLMVQVAPEGVAPFSLGLEAQPVAVRVPEKAARRVAVEVSGPLLFHASAEGVSYTAAVPAEAAGGLARLGQSAHSERLVAQGARAVGAFELDDGVEAEPLSVACAQLTLESVHREWPAEKEEPREGGLDFLPRGRRLVFRERPGAGAEVRVTLKSPSTFYMGGRGESGGWRRVEWSGGDGALLRGWVESASIKRVGSELHFAGIGGSTHCRAGCARGQGYGPGLYVGPAELRAGAAVFATEQGRGRWAAVRERASFAVEHWRGARFVTLRSVPGLEEGCDSLEHAFVAVEDVTFPASAGPRDALLLQGRPAPVAQ
jgi:hypothetical protein